MKFKIVTPPLFRGGFFFFLVVVLISFVSADESCGVTNLRGCLGDIFFGVVSKAPKVFFDFLLKVLNSPVKALLGIIQSLLTEPVKISVFAEPWAIVIYMLSLFYGLLLLFVGFRFIVSGESPEQREKAKSSLKNIIIMMILVQLSYYLYQLIIDVFSAMTKVVFKMIDQDFFLITADGITNTYLQFVLLIPYLSTLIAFIVLLSLRYILVASGVLLFAIGIFMYFTGFLKEYGAFIINLLITAISLPFFYSIIFLASSKMINVGIFSQFKILISLGAFSLIVVLTILLALFVIIKSASKVIKPIMKVASVVQGLI